MRRIIGSAVLSLSLATLSAKAADEGFKPIFDGKTLEGWAAPDMGYWSVEEGTITARSTPEHPCRANQFLTWRLGQVDDFELKVKFRIEGQPSANSGIQIRSATKPDGHVFGYQADIDREGKFTGVLYDELGRGVLALRGQDAEIKPGHKADAGQVASAKQPPAPHYNPDQWNEYHVIAAGNRITLRINGQTTAQVTDLDPGERELSGVLALQLHAGPPMKVQFKDIQLKRTRLTDGRKKVVFAAGHASHGFGAHDHKSGCHLLADRLNASGLGIEAVVYYPDYPADPTAFDNADSMVFYCDGGPAHPANAHLKELDEKVKAGVGMACIHYAVETTPGENGAAFLRWIGGYFEPNWSVNPFWRIKDMTLAAGHPITHGVRPFEITDEFYYHMRFREGMKGVTPIVTAMPPASTLVKPDGALARPDDPHSNNPEVRKAVLELHEPQHIAWASENQGGGRGFGFSGGHVHWNWANNDFRKLVLNAIAWTAKVDVPSTGVESRRPTVQEMLSNADEKPIAPEQAEKLMRAAAAP